MASSSTCPVIRTTEATEIPLRFYSFHLGCLAGYGEVAVGAHGVGGAAWSQKASLYLDFWVTALPAGVPAPELGPIYHQYADATGHAPPLREDAMSFWQSRNRYKSSDIALSIADRYQKLQLANYVGVLVIGSAAIPRVPFHVQCLT
jgi:alpha-glucosidase (family GH31 glycosyl hydrolase)